MKLLENKWAVMRLKIMLLYNLIKELFSHKSQENWYAVKKKSKLTKLNEEYYDYGLD